MAICARAGVAPLAVRRLLLAARQGERWIRTCSHTGVGAPMVTIMGLAFEEALVTYPQPPPCWVPASFEAGLKVAAGVSAPGPMQAVIAARSALGLHRSPREVEPGVCPVEAAMVCGQVGKDAPGAIPPVGWEQLRLGSAGTRSASQKAEALRIAQRQHDAYSRLIEEDTGAGAILYSDGSAKPPPTESRRARENSRIESASEDLEDEPKPAARVGRRRPMVVPGLVAGNSGAAAIGRELVRGGLWQGLRRSQALLPEFDNVGGPSCFGLNAWNGP